MGHVTRFLLYRHFLHNNIRPRKLKYRVEPLGINLKALRKVYKSVAFWNFKKKIQNSRGRTYLRKKIPVR